MRLFYVEHMVKYKVKDEETGKFVEKQKLDTVVYLARDNDHLSERLAQISWTPERRLAGYLLNDSWNQVSHLR